MDVFTAKNFHIDRAPQRITLLGDKTKRPEPAQHIIEFPGGAIEVSRTSDGDYWAHIIVNRGWADKCLSGRQSATGEVIDSRVDRHTGLIDSIEDQEPIRQIAVLIRPDLPAAAE